MYRKRLKALFQDKVKQQDKARYYRDPCRNKKYPGFKEYQKRVSLKKREARLINPELYRLKARENYIKNKALGKLWYKNNRDKYLHSLRAYRQRRRATDALFKFSCDLRAAMHTAIKRGGGRKAGKTADILGCSPADLRVKIENMFQVGMTWKNRGPIWQIDHRMPLASAKTSSEIEALWHHTNLRPMWTPENLAKSDTLPEDWDRLKQWAMA